jgi:hypothetical protein
MGTVIHGGLQVFASSFVPLGRVVFFEGQGHIHPEDYAATLLDPEHFGKLKLLCLSLPVSSAPKETS